MLRSHEPDAWEGGTNTTPLSSTCSRRHPPCKRICTEVWKGGRGAYTHPPPDSAWLSPVHTPPWCLPLDRWGVASPSVCGFDATHLSTQTGEAEWRAKGMPLPSLWPSPPMTCTHGRKCRTPHVTFSLDFGPTPFLSVLSPCISIPSSPYHSQITSDCFFPFSYLLSPLLSIAPCPI